MSRLRWESAHKLQEHRFALVALEPGGKRPIDPGWQLIRSSHQLIEQWFAANPNINIGIHCGFSGIAVADCDTDAAAEFVATELPTSPTFQHTPRGGLHVFYRDLGDVPHRLNVNNIGLDIRAKCGQIVAAPSFSREHQKRWVMEGLVSPIDLPVMPVGWLAPPKIEPIRIDKPSASIDWARRILHTEYHSIAGCGGDMNLFRAACFLVQRARLDTRTALALLVEWNEVNCVPPWPFKRLEYKTAEAERLMK